MKTSSPRTLEEFFEYIAPGAWLSRSITSWPPDVFALICSVLRATGAYTAIVDEWRPKPQPGWCDHIAEIGSDWRKSCRRGRAAPTKVVDWWSQVIARKAVCIDDLRVGSAGARRGASEVRELIYAMFYLLAAADEASVGVGLVSPTDSFERRAGDLLRTRSTACKRIDPSRARVLPKMHTPQSGLTIRSLSHHLALCPQSEIEPLWQPVGTVVGETENLNLLLLPWPTTIEPTQFRAITKTKLNTMPSSYRFFSYEPRVAKDIRRDLRNVLRRANEIVGTIDGVILPELSLTREAHEVARLEVTHYDAFLICGVYEPPKRKTDYGTNYVALDFPVGPTYIPLAQQKHHRWRLDKSQIIQYGLGGNLNPRCYWWEHSRLGKRDLIFCSLRSWLTMCALICEDLARQDPMSELVRSVGPNLVIAILLDGPQLTSRWPARYATVLADDPGSSVLTLTSLGMARLSRPPGLTQDPRVARTVALWKDANTSTETIELPEGAAGVVLNLAVDYVEEHTADGRSDHAVTGYPLLAGRHPVFL
jgi:hypothetical protein